jgi:L-iditol 2-dehydrogenase
VRQGQTVAVIGSGPIGLMLVSLARLRGASVVVAGRNAFRLRRALELGASEAIDVRSCDDLAERLGRAGRDGGGPDVVIEAAGLAETTEAALRAVRKGGLVNLFAGCAADARIALDAQRLHYEELTITSTFHHTPQSFRAAHRLIAEGQVRAEAYITGDASLEEVPAVLRHLAGGGDGLKTAILPWGE